MDDCVCIRRIKTIQKNEICKYEILTDGIKVYKYDFIKNGIVKMPFSPSGAVHYFNKDVTRFELFFKNIIKERNDKINQILYVS